MERRASIVIHTIWKYTLLLQSLYSLIGDIFMIWRLIKDFKSDIVLSESFDYDIDTLYI